MNSLFFLTGTGIEETPDEHFTDLNTWVERHLHHNVTINTADAKSPEAEYRVRVADEDDINRLVSSFTTTQTVHRNSIFVVFWPDDDDLPSKTWDLKIGSPMYDACAKNGFYFIGGDHTQLALKRVAAKWANNPNWKTITGGLLICRRTPVNIQRLKSWGILDNVKGQARTAISFASKILALHEDYDTVVREAGGINTKTCKAAMVSIKASRCKDYNMTTNSFGQLWTLASRTGSIWKCLKKIIQGNVANAKAFKKPKSAATFTNMGGIPDSDLRIMLEQVVCGAYTMTQFSTQCKIYKARARVQVAILSNDSINLDSWTVAQEKFPKTCAPGIVDLWAQYIMKNSLKQKQAMPPRFSQMIERLITMDEALNRSQLQLASVKLISLILMKLMSTNIFS